MLKLALALMVVALALQAFTVPVFAAPANSAVSADATSRAWLVAGIAASRKDDLSLAARYLLGVINCAPDELVLLKAETELGTIALRASMNKDFTLAKTILSTMEQSLTKHPRRNSASMLESVHKMQASVATMEDGERRLSTMNPLVQAIVRRRQQQLETLVKDQMKQAGMN